MFDEVKLSKYEYIIKLLIKIVINDGGIESIQ